MAVAFAEKLRMAAVALGCNARKEFCARFRSVNSATQCDLDRLNKWMQGRSLPRASSVYTDLAAVIGTTNTGRWIADCTVEEFAAELAACTGVDITALAVPDSAARRGNSQAAGLFGGLGTLCGAFAVYSPAWSPHFRGSVIRGTLRLSLGTHAALVATYTESLLGRDVSLAAEAWINGRSMHFVLREPDGDLPLFISVQTPGPPASVFCGVMSGMTFVAHEPMASACRIVFIRVPDTPMLRRTNRYFDPIPGVISADLAELGLDIPEADRLDGLVREFLSTSLIQATAHDQARFSSLLDHEHMISSVGGI